MKLEFKGGPVDVCEELGKRLPQSAYWSLAMG